MNPTILNRDFQHPTDGWYMIEPKGEHVNRPAGVVQVIDETAAESIVNAFRADAQRPNFAGMLVDHEHFKHDTDKETRAYGWLTDLQNRTDGIYGQIRWTNTGRAAVDGGDYRFFSTEYDRNDLKVINADKEVRRVRPLRLDGLTLTNSPNNKGGKPITNRTEPVLPSTEQFRRELGGSSVDNENKTQNQIKKMKSVANKLGLSADASEEAVLAEVVKIVNRAETAEKELAPLKNRATELETSNAALLGEQVDGLMVECGVKDAKLINRLKPMLGTMKNRAERLECLAEFGFKPNAEVKSPTMRNGAGRTLNREEGKTPADRNGSSASDEGQERAEKVTNRARELQGAAPTRSWENCWSQAQRESASK